MNSTNEQKIRLKKTALFFQILLLFSLPGKAQVMWPEGQVLPSFPATAQTQDLFYLNNHTAEEKYLFTSLKGIVNATQPRMFVYDGDQFAEGPYTWLNSLNLDWIEHIDNWELITKYRSEISGLIVYDPDQIHTVNLATTLAKDNKALVASPSFLTKLTSAPYNLPVLIDLRGQFTSKLDVYQTLYDTYWPTIDHRLLIGLSPEHHPGSLHEYAVALGAAVVWLDPDVTGESELLDSFLTSMPAGSHYMGWWPNETPGVLRASKFGIPTIPSDYCANLTVHSGMPRTINIKPSPPKPALKNKIYVAFILSDGDNLQYVEHSMRRFWDFPGRGTVPIGWTVSPVMLDAMPGALNYYYESATDNDNLISGPSGCGYTYPNFWPNQEELDKYVIRTEEYTRRAGIRVITVWNGPELAIRQNTGETYATYAPSLLGITGQNTGGELTIYNQSLPGKAMTCNYCENESWMKTFIDEGSAGWDGNDPRFLIIQANPWQGVNPSSFKNVADLLDSNYVVVRPDHIFQLIREANGLPVNPSGIYGTGDGLTGNYFNGLNFDTQVTTRRDHTINFDWDTGSPIAGVHADSFSVRWAGQVQPLYSEKYTFYVTSDDGVRLTINDNVLIDSLMVQGTATRNNTITLKAARKYDITLEYAERTGNATCNLEWQSASQERQVIPQIQLYPESIRLKPSTGPVTAYVDSAFSGFSTALEVGEYTLTDLNRIGIFDKEITSLKISKGYKIILYSKDDFGGESIEIKADTSYLGSWNDSVTSLKVKTYGLTDLSGIYMIQNRASSYYMDIEGGTGATGDGTNVLQYSTTSKTNQQFKINHLGDGAYQILAQHSNKSISIAESDTSDGANVEQRTSSGLPNQKFLLMPAGDSYYKIMAQHSGKIVEAENMSSGGNVRQMTDNDQAQGQWKLLPVPEGVIGTGTGLTANYYNGMNFESHRYTTIDTTINFNWKQGSPNSYVGPDNFSVRWTGFIQPNFTSHYTFYINSDNGRRLWVNNVLIIDEWVNDWGTEYSGSISLNAGEKYEIKLEYFEDNGGAACKLEWISEFQGREVVPKSQLYPEAPTGINYDAKATDLNIFPNPTTGKIINIQLSGLQENEKALLTISDIPGNLILQTKVHRSDQIDMDKLVPGIYFVNIRSKSININKKIIIQ